MSKCKIPNPYKKDGTFFHIPPYRQLGPGPCNSSTAVMQALTIQPVAITNKLFYKILNETQEMIKYLYQTTNSFTFIQQTSGNGGNEAMVVNLADPGETIVVAVAGIWGVRVAEMGRRYNLNVVELKSERGEVYSFEELEEAIVKHKAVALFVTHGESTGGTLQPLNGLGDICHKHNCLLAVDAVMTVGVVPLLVDEWQLDAVNGGTQKGLGAPAGMCLMTFSERAKQKILSKKHKTPFIYDILVLGDMWKCFDTPRRYFYTFGIHSINCVRQALVEICEEGLENIWERHEQCSKLFMSKVKNLGIKYFVEKPENRFLGACCLCLPDDVNWRLLLDYCIRKHQIEFGFGVGPTSGANNIRVSFLAKNAFPDVVNYFLNALEDGFDYCRKNPSDSKTCDVTKIMSEWGF